MSEKIFHIKILGRLLELLGGQMYKQLDAALAELVANSWDADAKKVSITINNEVGKEYISIMDSGTGMNEESIQDEYLVIARNRRFVNNDLFSKGGKRRVMGRKGIGKLAGFGIADKMQVTTWQGEITHRFTIESALLRSDNQEVSEEKITATVFNTESDKKIFSNSGTEIKLLNLKQKKVDIQQLKNSLSRRFSRIVKGEMNITINKEEIKDPELEGIIFEFPAQGDYQKEKLSNGKDVKYRYTITDKKIPTKLNQGFVVMVNGKVAQAPPFYFNLENVIAHQHAAKYFTGEIHADFLDDGTDNNSDLISTDRQEINWDLEVVKDFKKWGEKLTRRVHEEWFEKREKEIENEMVASFSYRIDELDTSSKKSVRKIIPIIVKNELDKESAHALVDNLLMAYEFKTFHDIANNIEEVANEDPLKVVDLIKNLSDFRIIESRALFGIINGRLHVIRTLEKFILNDVPETPSSKSDDNLHDLIARMPWVLNADWYIYEDEKTIKKTLEEWEQENQKLTEKDGRKRYDFIALKSGTSKLIIIEIKRSGHAVTLEEVQRLEKYKDDLSSAYESVDAVMIASRFELKDDVLQRFRNAPGFSIYEWKDILVKTKKNYVEYLPLLESETKSSGFKKLEEEAKQHKLVSKGQIKRTKLERKSGISQNNEIKEKVGENKRKITK